MRGYTVGFVLSSCGQYVLLLEKAKPRHHVVLYNGIGGKRDKGETWLTCIARECREETGLDISHNRWHLIERWFADDGNDLFCYTAIYHGNMGDITAGDEGTACWFPITSIPEKCIADVPRLVALSIKTLKRLRGAG